MVKHHLTAREGRTGGASVAINGFSAFLSFTVVLIFAVAKFTEGAWVDRGRRPAPLLRAHPPAPPVRRGGRAARDAARPRRPRRPSCAATSSCVLVDRLDLATARALQYARTLDARRPARGALRHRHQGGPASSRTSGAGSGCPPPARHHRVPGPPPGAGRARAGGRRHRSTATPSARCCCPGAASPRGWQRFLHDRTADKIAAVLGQVPHVSATIVPFNVGGRFGERVRSLRPVGAAGAPRRRADGATADRRRRAHRPRPHGPARRPRRPATVLAADADAGPARPGRRRRSPRCVPRQRVRVAGRVKSVRVQPRAGTLEPRVRADRRHRRAAARVPGPAQDRRDRARRPPGRRGHGGHVGPPARHAQPRPSSWSQGAPSDPAEPEPTLGRPRRAGPKLPVPAPVANVPPGPESGATSSARPRPGVTTSTAVVPSAAAPARTRATPPLRAGSHRNRKGTPGMINLLAAEGGYQTFHLGGTDKTWLYICLVAGIVGIAAGPAARPQRAGRRPGHGEDAGDRPGDPGGRRRRS